MVAFTLSLAKLWCHSDQRHLFHSADILKHFSAETNCVFLTSNLKGDESPKEICQQITDFPFLESFVV